jgi:radical SAM superfamily enzyme YgiQ (UPF0313 family)
MVHGIIFSGWKNPSIYITPQAGPYRLRTFLGEHGYDIEVIDHLSHWTIKEVMELIAAIYTPDLIFIGISCVFYYKLKENLLKRIRLRWPDVKILLGAQEVRPYAIPGGDFADKVFFGYSETSLLHYLDFTTGKRSDDLDWVIDDNFGNPYQYVISDKQHPYTNTADLKIVWKPHDPINKNTSLPLEISRGCIFRCLFCTYPLLGKKQMDYIRDVQNMADEFKRNYEMFGTTFYSFMDDTLNESVAKLEWINKAIKLSGVSIRFSCYMRIDLVASFPEMADIMADMGLLGGFLGIESLDDNVRKGIRKGLTTDRILATVDLMRQKSQKKIWFEAGLIAGLPGDTHKLIRATNKWLISENNRYFDYWIWNPLYIARRQKWLISEFDRNHAKYGYTFPDDNYENNWERKGKLGEVGSFHEAQRLVAALDREGAPHIGLSSWMIPHYIGYEMSLEELDKPTVKRVTVFEEGKFMQRKAKIIDDYKTATLARVKKNIDG